METRASPWAGRTGCRGCGRGVPADEAACSLCGTLVHRDASVAPTPPPGSTPDPFLGTPPARESDRVLVVGLPPAAFACVAGAGIALLLAFAPVLRFAGWFLGSLFHETGHAAAGWLLGTPAYPAIRLDGHAAAVHREWSAALAVLAWAGIVALAIRQRRRPALLATLSLLALGHPLVAFTSAREVVFLGGGHLGEIAFGAFFLSRGIAGGFTGSRAEQVAHAGLGLFLLGRNVALSAGLLWSEDARSLYADNGSFGLVNDYLRLAHECFGSTLAPVAAGSLLAAIAAVPVAVVVGLRAGRLPPPRRRIEPPARFAVEPASQRASRVR